MTEFASWMLPRRGKTSPASRALTGVPGHPVQRPVVTLQMMRLPGEPEPCTAAVACGQPVRRRRPRPPPVARRAARALVAVVVAAVTTRSLNDVAEVVMADIPGWAWLTRLSLEGRQQVMADRAAAAGIKLAAPWHGIALVSQADADKLLAVLRKDAEDGAALLAPLEEQDVRGFVGLGGITYTDRPGLPPSPGLPMVGERLP